MTSPVPTNDTVAVDLAKQLRSAGLRWRPAWGDRFHIPDRNLDDKVFVIADLSIDLTILADGIGAITFNGAVEWSLDYILTQDVVWLPSEAQLRDRLGDRFSSLIATRSGFRCALIVDGEPLAFEATSAADVYAIALLHTLEAQP